MSYIANDTGVKPLINVTFSHQRISSSPQFFTDAAHGDMGRYKISYDHHLVSLEQPPPGFNALLKQRLRWSQGWYQ
eukprot:823109-Pyramimonas_sp.AAC.1